MRPLRRLLSNRNIRLDARVLMELGGGPYVSTSTYGMACAGRLPLRDEYVNAFARTVGLPAESSPCPTRSDGPPGGYNISSMGATVTAALLIGG
jgi:hypothetical protein